MFTSDNLISGNCSGDDLMMQDKNSNDLHTLFEHQKIKLVVNQELPIEDKIMSEVKLSHLRSLIFLDSSVSAVNIAP